MEYIPFLHANQVFSIACEEDLAFSDVRAILDALLEENAFNLALQETQAYYRIEFDESLFEVWVAEMSVFIRRLVSSAEKL